MHFLCDCTICGTRSLLVLGALRQHLLNFIFAPQEPLNVTGLWRNNSIAPPPPPHALSLSEYFGSSSVIAMLMFLAALGQGQSLEDQ